jgi:hypothetical protein
MQGWPVTVLLVLLAIVFAILAVLYEMGSIQFLTSSGTGHAHHTTHAILFGILAVLSLVGANFARPKSSAV